jgi:hypothetical protein
LIKGYRAAGAYEQANRRYYEARRAKAAGESTEEEAAWKTMSRLANGDQT